MFWILWYCSLVLFLWVWLYLDHAAHAKKDPGIDERLSRIDDELRKLEGR